MPSGIFAHFLLSFLVLAKRIWGTAPHHRGKIRSVGAARTGGPLLDASTCWEYTKNSRLDTVRNQLEFTHFSGSGEDWWIAALSVSCALPSQLTPTLRKIGSTTVPPSFARLKRDQFPRFVL
jgi:hypothetical protein